MEQLGIDWKILIGQVINFVILLYLLKKFAYKPFFDVLEKRKKTIEEGVRKSESAEASLQKIREMSDKVMAKADNQAAETMRAAEARSLAAQQRILSLAEKEKESIIETARKIAQKEALEEKDKRQKEAADLAFLLAEKILKEKINRDKDKDFIQETINSLK